MKLIVSFLAVATIVTGISTYYFQILIHSTGAVPIPIITIILAITMAVLALLITVFVILPLRKIAKNAEQIARGNFGTQVYSGNLTKGRFKKSDELSRLVMAFEVMRKKVVEVDVNLNKQIGMKTLDLQRINDELVEKDKVLQRANAKLVGQSEDLKKINEQLLTMNEELSETNAKMQRLDKMKTDFILLAAHELRTPIQPIMGSIKLAERGIITNEKAWKTITNEAKRLSSVASYILDVSKIESGNFSYDMKPISLAQLIEKISSSSAKFATQDGVIAINIELDEEVKIMGDAERLSQAFANVIDNAAKFAKNGTIKIQTINNYDDGTVKVMIQDDGPGIPEEILPVLFNKFVTKTRENERGTGLGLFITKSIIEAHSGSISAENNHDKGGATFTILFPIHEKELHSLSVIE